MNDLKLGSNYVGDLISARDKTNVQYINRDNPHLRSWFNEDDLGLNSLFNIISELIIVDTESPRSETSMVMEEKLGL